MYKNTFFTKLKIFFYVVTVLFFYNAVAQTNIAVWDFDAFPSGYVNPATSFGAGTASVINQSAINPLTAFNALGTAGGNGNVTAPIGCGTVLTGAAWQISLFDSGTFNESNGLEFKSSTVGYENIFFKWDQRWSNTAPNTLRIKYTLDGTTWQDFTMTNSNSTYCFGALNATGTYEAANPGDSFRRFTVNFSAIAGANNNPNFGVRLLASHFQSTSDFRQTTDNSLTATNTGTWRFDNVAFAGSLFAGATGAVITASTTAVCGGDSANLSVAITGGKEPFNLIYTNDGGTTLFTVSNYISGANIPITPTLTGTYSIVSVQNAPAVIGTSNFGFGNAGAPTITFNAKPTFNATNGSACAGSFNLTNLFTSQSPAGGSSTYINDATNIPISSFTAYTGPTVTIRYTYTRSGCPTTKIVTFTRTSSPVITTQPSNATQTVCQGDVFPALFVVATGTSMVYSWYVNTTNSTTGGTLIQTTNAASYTPPSTTVGTKWYYVQVSGGCSPAVKSTAFGTYVVVDKTTTRTISTPQTICSGYAPNNLTISGTGTVTKWQKADDAAFTTNVVDIANTTATLATGNLIKTTYFRTLVSNGTCDVATAPIEITVKTANYTTAGWNITPDATTTAIFWDDFSSTTNISACNVIIKPGKNVVFNPTHTLTVQNEIDVSAGTLTFENNANLYQINDIANPNSGNITYKRHSTTMNVYDFTYWSSPVANQNLNAFSPNTLFDKYYIWNANAGVYNWQILNSTTTTMQPATGYVVRSPLIPGEAPTYFPGIFSGTPNNGLVTKAIQVSNGGLNSLNLIGNPYPSTLSVDDFLNTNDAVIYKTIYLWTHNTTVSASQLIYNNNDYATYDLTGLVGTNPTSNSGLNNNTPTGFISAGQAFFVNGKSSNDVIFNNAMRRTNSNVQFFRSNNNIEKNRLWLEMSNIGGAFSQMLFGYVTGATNNKDDGYDSNLFDESTTISLYSILNNEKMTIKADALPFEENKTNQLGFISNIESDFEIKLAQFDGIFDYQSIYLQDNFLHLTHDLRQSSYNFHTTVGTFNDRFLLRFTNNNLSSNQNSINQNGIQVFKQNNDILVQSSNEKIASISVFDLNGRLLLEKQNIDNDKYIINNWLIANQMILIKTTIQSGLTITKKIVF